MFTEGLDESAINWINQGTELDQQEPTPFRERFDLDSLAQPPVLYNRDYFTPTILPPLKFYSGFLGSHGNRSLGFEGDNESAVSVPDDSDMDCSDPFEDEGLGSSDSDLHEKPILRSCNEDLHTEKIDVKLNWKSVPGSDFIQDPSETKGFSKENLKTEILLNARRFTEGDLGIRGFVETRSVSSCEDQAEEQNSSDTYVHLADQDMHKKLPEAGTPSAPPIFDVGRDASGIELPSTTSNKPNETRASIHSKDGLADIGKASQKTSDPCPSSILGDVGMQIPCKQANSIDQKAYYSISGQNSWQSIVAYDACIRLCLHAWARGCMEAPEFLQDECIVLRNSFGLQKFLLQPRAENPREGRIVDNIEETCMVKAKKSIGKIKVEVKKIRVIPRRKLHTTYSQWGGMYMQAGAEYVRHVSALLKSGINSLKTTSFSVTSQETLSCLLQLKSSSEGTQMELGSAISMQPGSGESHVFLSESQGDTLLLEVQDTKGTTQGRATIQISSLTDNPNDRIRWWPIYHEDQECMGKVQLAISSTNIAGEISSIKFGPVSETLAYDLALEAAMRTQNFHSRNLQLYGPWKWLLTEFADYYGVSDVYTKLRYLSCVMDMATPTKDCLELVHELLLPIVKARDENNLNRQERRMFSDCEFQVKRLLSTVFENYKSLDELAPTGLADSISSTSEVAAPALVPAVQVYTLLHDILAQEAQATLRNYLQTAAWKRCKRHVLETDEFTSNNNEGILMDPLTISTAYLKMKTLCMNISKEIETDIKIHNQHILPSSIDLPNIAAAVYSTELCNRLRGFLKACPPSGPLPYVTELLIATADFQRDLQSWNISPIVGGVDSKNLFHHYIMLWIQDKRLWLLELCKADKASWSGITQHTTSPFIEEMYDHIKETLNEYEVVINRWPQYALVLENAIADIERAIMKALEKQYSDILAPLKDSIPKMLGMQVQKFTRRHSVALYTVPNQLGTFLNTVKRILDILHCKVESVLKSWAFYLPGPGDRKAAFGEQLNGITVMLRTKYKNYMQATVEKLVSNTQANRGTRLKRIIEETKEAEGEAEIRERMQMLTSELTESICNLHDVFSGRIFVAICRGFWDRMGQGVLSFLASRKENRIWYKGSYYALGILDDTFASQMQRLQGNALQEKDLEPPRSVIEARSILCRDTQNTADSSTYFYF